MSDLVTPLLTVLGSGIVAALVSASLSEGKERWQIRRQKAEEVFLDAYRYSRRMQTLYLEHYQYFQGGTTHSDFYKILQKDNEKPDDIRNLEMNVYIFQPDLIPNLISFMDQRDRTNNIMMRCIKERAQRVACSPALMEQFDQALEVFNTSVDELKTAVVASGRSIAEEGTQVERMATAAKRMAVDGAGRIKALIPPWLRRRGRPPP